MSFTGPLEDRLLIRELYDRYADACWRADREEWLSCFIDDARWTTHLFACSGKGEMGETWDRIAADWVNVAFQSVIGSIEVSGETAKARSYAREIVEQKMAEHAFKANLIAMRTADRMTKAMLDILA